MTALTDPPPAGTPTTSPPTPRMRHRRLVLLVLWAAFALWVAALAAMYVLSVYPHRHPPDARPPAREHRAGSTARAG